MREAIVALIDRYGGCTMVEESNVVDLENFRHKHPKDSFVLMETQMDRGLRLTWFDDHGAYEGVVVANTRCGGSIIRITKSETR